MAKLDTTVFTIKPESFAPEELDAPARIVREGGIVGFPTETVYGLAANAQDPEAVHRLTLLKDRPKEKPFSIHIADTADVEKYVSDVPRLARRLMELYWPGPLTLIFPGSAGTGIGLRLPSSAIARELIRRSGVPIIAPSANLAGETPAITAQEVLDVFKGRIEGVIDGGRVAIRQASTVVRLNGDRYEVLREGIITEDMIRRALKGKVVLFVCTGNSCRSPMAEAMMRRLLAERLDVPVERLVERGYRIGSAGIAAFAGGHASRFAVEVMEEKGMDISSHSARPVTRALTEEADLIVALSPSHRWQLVQYDRSIADKVEVIRELGVSDPIGGTIDEYRECAEEIERELRFKWLDRICDL